MTVVRPDPGAAVAPITSSASQPNVVARMLAALDVAPGMTVCEIGTRTGYNAALLAHRLGARSVTTIEVDPQIAAHARQALAHAGYDGVTTVTGDGSDGYWLRVPYDRVLANVCPRIVSRISGWRRPARVTRW